MQYLYWIIPIPKVYTDTRRYHYQESSVINWTWTVCIIFWGLQSWIVFQTLCKISSLFVIYFFEITNLPWQSHLQQSSHENSDQARPLPQSSRWHLLDVTLNDEIVAHNKSKWISFKEPKKFVDSFCILLVVVSRENVQVRKDHIVIFLPILRLQNIMKLYSQSISPVQVNRTRSWLCFPLSKQEQDKEPQPKSSGKKFTTDLEFGT